MENKVKISVIIPVYNAERYIKRCIDCVYAQSFKDYEIILVNDGSTDDSLSICNEYAKKDPKIRVIDKENGGAGSARNAGIEAARGEYLAFPDADDWFSQDMYEDLYRVAKEKDYDIVFSGVNYYGDFNGELKYKSTSTCGDKEYLTKEDCRKHVMDFFPTSTIFDVPWNKLYKREVAMQNGVRFSDHKRCQDAMFNIDFFNASKSVASVDKAYYNYIENTTEGFNRKFPKNYIDIVVIYYSHLKEILTSWGMYEGNIKIHYDSSFALAVYGAMQAVDNPNWKLTKNEKIKFVSDILERDDVQKMLVGASIRDDVKEVYRIIKERDVKAFFKDFRREKLKDNLRKNKFVMKIYKFIKKT